MHCIPGSPALSDFRLQKLQQQFKYQGIELIRLSSRYIHLVDMGERDLSDNNKQILTNLLTYGPSAIGNQSS